MQIVHPKNKEKLKNSQYVKGTKRITNKHILYNKRIYSPLAKKPPSLKSNILKQGVLTC